MKVLFVINGLGTGGAERSLAEMLPLLRERGVDPVVACFHRRAEGVEASILAQGFDVRFLVDLQGSRRVRALRQLIRTEEPDIVHTAIYEADVAGRLAAVGLGRPVVTSLVNTSYDRRRFADPRVRRWKLVVARAIDGWTGRYLTDHFHAITEAVRDASVDALRIPPARISVVARGRDPRRMGCPSAERRRAVRQALGVDEAALVVLNVGRQEFQKGQADLLRAVGLLRSTHPQVLLLQAGRRGHATEELEALVRAGDLPVRFLGHRDDIPDLLAASDLFAFPSVYEGLGGAVLEAMALGLPIVASDIPALREVVAPGCNADLVAPGDVPGLAAALAALVEEPDRRARYASASRDRFEERFTLDRSVDQMVTMYEQVCARPMEVR